jgi:hypothetical protein
LSLAPCASEARVGGVATMLPGRRSIRADLRRRERTTVRPEHDVRQRLVAGSPSPSSTWRIVSQGSSPCLPANFRWHHTRMLSRRSDAEARHHLRRRGGGPHCASSAPL